MRWGEARFPSQDIGLLIPPFMFWQHLLCVYISPYRHIKTTLKEIKRVTIVIHSHIAITQLHPHACISVFNYTSRTWRHSHGHKLNNWELHIAVGKCLVHTAPTSSSYSPEVRQLSVVYLYRSCSEFTSNYWNVTIYMELCMCIYMCVWRERINTQTGSTYYKH